MREHARHREMRGVRIRADVGARTGEACVQARFAGVGWSDQAQLRGAVWAHDMGRPAAAAALPGPGELLGQLLDTCLDVGLEVVRTLVLGDGPQHLLQAVQSFLWLSRLSIGLLGLLVLGRNVSGHIGGFYLTNILP